MKIRKHIPNFCDGIEQEIVEFKDFNELKEIPFVKSWITQKGFERFFLAMLNDLDCGYLLLAKFKPSNKSAYVVGYIDKLDLPDCVKGEQIFI